MYNEFIMPSMIYEWKFEESLDNRLKMAEDQWKWWYYEELSGKERS